MGRDLDESEANALAEKVLAVDSSILHVGVISNSGPPLGGAIKKSLRGKLSSDKKDWEKQALRVAAVMGIIRADDTELSPIESVILIRKEAESLLIRVPDKGVILAVVFEKSRNGLDLNNKIMELLAGN